MNQKYFMWHINLERIKLCILYITIYYYNNENRIEIRTIDIIHSLLFNPRLLCCWIMLYQLLVRTIWKTQENIDDYIFVVTLWYKQPNLSLLLMWNTQYSWHRWRKQIEEKRKIIKTKTKVQNEWKKTQYFIVIIISSKQKKTNIFPMT